MQVAVDLDASPASTLKYSTGGLSSGATFCFSAALSPVTSNDFVIRQGHELADTWIVEAGESVKARIFPSGEIV